METQIATSSRSKPKSELAPESGAVVKLKPLRDGLKELETAYELMRASRTAFRDKLKVVAEKSCLEPSVIRAFVAARMIEDSEKIEHKVERAKQLMMVFEEIGV